VLEHIDIPFKIPQYHIQVQNYLLNKTNDCMLAEFKLPFQ